MYLQLVLLLLPNALVVMAVASSGIRMLIFSIFHFFGNSASHGVGRTMILLAQGLNRPVEMAIFQA